MSTSLFQCRFAIVLLFCTLILSSCSVYHTSIDNEVLGTAWISGGTQLYRYDSTTLEYESPSDVLKVKEGNRLKVWVYEDYEGHTFVQVYGDKDYPFWNFVENGNDYGEDLPYLAWSPYSKTAVSNKGDLYLERASLFKFTYFKYDFTASVLPFKYRRRVEFVPRQISTKFGVQFSPSISYGIRTKSMHFFEKVYKEKSFDYRISLSPFIGMSTANLNDNSTDGVVAIADARDMWVTSGGLMVFAGFQKLNIGFGIGWDLGILDPDRSSWIYEGKYWYGVAIGYNLFNR